MPLPETKLIESPLDFLLAEYGRCIAPLNPSIWSNFYHVTYLMGEV